LTEGLILVNIVNLAHRDWVRSSNDFGAKCKEPKYGVTPKHHSSEMNEIIGLEGFGRAWW